MRHTKVRLIMALLIGLLAGVGVEKPAWGLLNFQPDRQHYSGDGWASLGSVNGRNLPIYRNVIASYYTYGSNSVHPQATSTGISYNTNQLTAAVAMRALYHVAPQYRIAYGDILLVIAPNGRWIPLAVTDTGTLFADPSKDSPRGNGRLVDLSPRGFTALGYSLSDGLIRGLTVLVIDRVCEPPQGVVHKFPGCSQEQVRLQIAKAEELSRNPSLLATRYHIQLTASRHGFLGDLTHNLSSGIRNFFGGILSSWMSFIKEREKRNRLLAEQFPKTVAAFNPQVEDELNRVAQSARQGESRYYIDAQRRYYSRPHIPTFEAPVVAQQPQQSSSQQNLFYRRLIAPSFHQQFISRQGGGMY
jgi:hypothetical protein